MTWYTCQSLNICREVGKPSRLMSLVSLDNFGLNEYCVKYEFDKKTKETCVLEEVILTKLKKL